MEDHLSFWEGILKDKGNKKTKAQRADNNVFNAKTTILEDGHVVDEIEVEETVELIQAKKGGALIYEESPFLRNWKLETDKKLYTVARGTTMLDPGGKNVPAVTRVQQEVEVDRKTFVKLFAGELRHVYGLTPAGLKMFMVLLDLLSRPENINQVNIRCTWPMVKRLLKESDSPAFSYPTFNRAMKDLVDNDYIAGAAVNGETDGWWWINQDRFYNGNQVILVKKIKLARQNKAHEARVHRAVYPKATQAPLFDDPVDQSDFNVNAEE